MVASERLSIIAVTVGVGLVAATTIPALKQIPSRPKRLYEALYEDDDGVATEEAISAYSDRIPKFILCFSSIIGFLASIVSLVFASLYPEKSLLIESWITVLCWVSLNSFLHLVLYSTRRLAIGRGDCQRTRNRGASMNYS